MKQSIKDKYYTIIFEADTPKGKAFDVALLVFIFLSVLAAILESVEEIRQIAGTFLYYFEWGITILFTLEYVFRIILVLHPYKYIFSFYGIIDLLAILPTYLSIFLIGTHSLVVIRGLRLLRVFRILKLSRFSSEANIIVSSLKNSKAKISVFLFAILTIIIIIGTLMYLIEGESNGFNNIPRSIYWAIVTVTTVGYGDITPQTTFGQFIASFAMIIGYAIIAVPTGIVTSEIIKSKNYNKTNTHVCPGCMDDDHNDKAKFCKTCGTKLS